MSQIATRTQAMSLPDYLAWLATTIEPSTAAELRERAEQSRELIAACEEIATHSTSECSRELARAALAKARGDVKRATGAVSADVECIKTTGGAA